MLRLWSGKGARVIDQQARKDWGVGRGCPGCLLALGVEMTESALYWGRYLHN
jgi:hypothetical protein